MTVEKSSRTLKPWKRFANTQYTGDRMDSASWKRTCVLQASELHPLATVNFNSAIRGFCATNRSSTILIHGCNPPPSGRYSGTAVGQSRFCVSFTSASAIAFICALNWLSSPSSNFGKAVRKSWLSHQSLMSSSHDSHMRRVSGVMRSL